MNEAKSDIKPKSLKSSKLVKLSQVWNDIKPDSCSLIIFDIETSGLSVNESEILQLSAICNKNEFNTYIFPQNMISPSASAVNKLYIVDEVLFYDGEPVDSILLSDALKSFLNWLSNIPPPRILVGHNVKRFDCAHFFNALAQYNFVNYFCNLVIGFIDTLPLYREIIPHMPNYRQNTLVKNLIGHTYEEHNAIADVRALQKLLQSTSISNLLYLQYSFTSESFWDFFQFNNNRKANLLTYTFMINNGISKGMANKFAENDITYFTLMNAYKIGGRIEVENVLSEEVNGVLRGTKNKNVIDGILGYLEKKLNKTMEINK